jgi:hypothetical protein
LPHTSQSPRVVRTKSQASSVSNVSGTTSSTENIADIAMLKFVALRRLQVASQANVY